MAPINYTDPSEILQPSVEHEPEALTKPLLALMGTDPAKPPSTTAPDPVLEVFEYWQTVLEHPRARLDDKRRKTIRTALKLGYSVDQLKEAINGCSRTPHNMGINDRGERYDDIGLILRDAAHIDRFARNAGRPAAVKSAGAQPKRGDVVDGYRVL